MQAGIEFKESQPTRNSSAKPNQGAVSQDQLWREQFKELFKNDSALLNFIQSEERKKGYGNELSTAVQKFIAAIKPSHNNKPLSATELLDSLKEQKDAAQEKVKKAQTDVSNSEKLARTSLVGVLGCIVVQQSIDTPDYSMEIAIFLAIGLALASFYTLTKNLTAKNIAEQEFENVKNIEDALKQLTNAKLAYELQAINQEAKETKASPAHISSSTPSSSLNSGSPSNTRPIPVTIANPAPAAVAPRAVNGREFKGNGIIHPQIISPEPEFEIEFVPVPEIEPINDVEGDGELLQDEEQIDGQRPPEQKPFNPDPEEEEEEFHDPEAVHQILDEIEGEGEEQNVGVPVEEEKLPAQEDLGNEYILEPINQDANVEAAEDKGNPNDGDLNNQAKGKENDVKAAADKVKPDEFKENDVKAAADKVKPAEFKENDRKAASGERKPNGGGINDPIIQPVDDHNDNLVAAGPANEDVNYKIVKEGEPEPELDFQLDGEHLDAGGKKNQNPGSIKNSGFPPLVAEVKKNDQKAVADEGKPEAEGINNQVILPANGNNDNLVAADLQDKGKHDAEKYSIVGGVEPDEAVLNFQQDEDFEAAAGEGKPNAEDMNDRAVPPVPELKEGEVDQNSAEPDVSAEPAPLSSPLDVSVLSSESDQSVIQSESKVEIAAPSSPLAATKSQELKSPDRSSNNNVNFSPIEETIAGDDAFDTTFNESAIVQSKVLEEDKHGPEPSSLPSMNDNLAVAGLQDKDNQHGGNLDFQQGGGLKAADNKENPNPEDIEDQPPVPERKESEVDLAKPGSVEPEGQATPLDVPVLDGQNSQVIQGDPLKGNEVVDGLQNDAENYQIIKGEPEPELDQLNNNSAHLNESKVEIAVAATPVIVAELQESSSDLSFNNYMNPLPIEEIVVEGKAIDAGLIEPAIAQPTSNENDRPDPEPLSLFSSVNDISDNLEAKNQKLDDEPIRANGEIEEQASEELKQIAHDEFPINEDKLSRDMPSMEDSSLQDTSLMNDAPPLDEEAPAPPPLEDAPSSFNSNSSAESDISSVKSKKPPENKLRVESQGNDLSAELASRLQQGTRGLIQFDKSSWMQSTLAKKDDSLEGALSSALGRYRSHVEDDDPADIEEEDADVDVSIDLEPMLNESKQAKDHKFVSVEAGSAFSIDNMLDGIPQAPPLEAESKSYRSSIASNIVTEKTKKQAMTTTTVADELAGKLQSEDKGLKPSSWMQQSQASRSPIKEAGSGMLGSIMVKFEQEQEADAEEDGYSSSSFSL